MNLNAKPETELMTISTRTRSTRVLRIPSAAVIYLVLIVATFTSSIPRAAHSSQLAEQIKKLVDQHQGQVSVAIEFLDSGKQITFEADRMMPTASLIKVAVMAEVYQQVQQGQLDLSQKIVLNQSDKVPGSGILTSHFSPGTSLSLKDAVRLMIAFSDNTATNLVIDQVGLKNVCRTMEKLQLANTKINSKVYRGSSTSISQERSKSYGLGNTTAHETLTLFKLLYQKKLISPEASEEMLNHLAACENQKIARSLPARANVANKTGSISHARCDAAILKAQRRSAIVVVFTAKNKDRSWSPSNSADVLCGKIGQLVYQELNAAPTKSASTSASKSASKVLTVGDFGTLVEDLQRTLNERLVPSPELSVDGDFGPATKAAVLRFQKSAKLKSDGIFDADDWKELGVLVAAKPVAAPELVNQQELEKAPADPLTGPPFVTAKAWAVADLKSGQILFQSNSDQVLDIASTTKIMTAYLVLELAEKDPKVLDEKITFSERADQTRGSTSGIRAGEIVSVRNLLYGLLLPSGNDASVALAEHFGSRLKPKTQDNAEQASSYDYFILAMNAKAKSLGMMQTAFKNPHGLTVAGHHSTAADLIRLGRAAMDLKSFRKYVSTRQFGCTLHSKTGYQRNVIWKNTNQLLKTEGYLGIKTGTTSAAGACLVSVSKRAERELIMVTLGSGSSRGRYVDSRNLYRWVWNQVLKQDRPSGGR